MSDLSIPGVKDKYGTQKLVEDLMKVERIPKVRAEEELKKIEKQKGLWQDLGVRMSRLRDSSRNLFSFNNPFTARTATSSDEAALTATASREALEGVNSIEIKQVAQADRLLTDKLPKDYKVAAGNYQFGVGDKSVSIQFGGGSLSEFAEALNRRGKDLIRAQVMSIEKSTQSLLIEGTKTGKSQGLSFQGAAESFALSSGMAEKTISSERKIALSPALLRAWTKPIDPSLVQVSEGLLSVKAGAEAAIALSPALKAGGDVLFEFEMRLRPRPEDQQDKGPPSGPAIPETGSILFEGISISSESSTVPLPGWTPPSPPPRVDDLNIAFAGLSSGAIVSLGATQESEEFVKVSFKLSDIGGDLSQLNIRNRNTHRDVELRNIRSYDPNESGGFKAKNPVSTAQDAIIKLDGIEVRRETNNVDDLIPGVSLNILDKTERPLRLSVQPDYEGVKESLISWVAHYNQLMTEINILSQTNDKVVTEIDYFTEDEKKSALERLGIFQGDFTLSQVKTSMQRISSAAYETKEGSKLSLLQQLGISTDARASGASSGFDASRLRGYLEIDEAKLDAGLKNRMPAVKELFGSDSDGDVIIDSGAAYGLDALIRPYVETAGILSQKQQTMSDRITRQKQTITNMESQLVTKEKDLKRKYGLMESALNQMERSSSSIENFNKRNSGN